MGIPPSQPLPAGLPLPGPQPNCQLFFPISAPLKRPRVTRAALTVGGTQSRDDETSKVRVEPTTSLPGPGLAALPRTPPSLLYIAPSHHFPEGSQEVRAR